MVCLSRIIVLHLSDWTLTEFVENSSGSKTVGFFSMKQELNLWVSSCFSYFIPPKINSSVKTISISSDNDFSPLRRYCSRSHNSFMQDVNNKKTA